MFSRLSLSVVLLLTMLISACSLRTEAAPTPTPTPHSGYVDWEIAVEIIHSGQVAEIYQLHNLDVTLVLKDGGRIQTIEPIIDAVFQEIGRCGPPCSEIILTTE